MKNLGSTLKRTGGAVLRSPKKPTAAMDPEQAGKEFLKHMKGKDEGAFTLGVLNFALVLWVAAKTPSWYWVLYVLKAIVLIPMRYFSYRKDGAHYFLLDFCYLTNIFITLHCVFVLIQAYTPSTNATVLQIASFQPLVAKILFLWTSGPLLWSISLFRNSLVFHSVDKLTSFFIHISPTFFMWCSRWYPTLVPEMMDFCGHSVVAPATCDMGFPETWGLGIAAYAATWALPYYLVVFVFASERIDRKRYTTLYSWTRETNPVVKACVKKAGPNAGPIAYMGLHLLLTMASTGLAWVQFNYFWAHTIFIIAMCTRATWNGSTFYFEVFASRYAAGLEEQAKQHREKVEEKQQVM